MSSLAYIITYRESASPERRRNLVTVLQWLSTLADVEPVVIEQDARPTLDALDFPGVHLAFHYNPGPFNKAWGLNVGARRVKHALLAFGDADLIAPHGWNESVALLRQRFVAAKPYRRIVDLDPDETARVAAGDLRWLPERDPASLDRHAQGERLCFAGGLFLIRRDAFFRIGGFDERFVGWGGEDDAMTLRMQAGGVEMGGMDGIPALHLCHPRAAPGTAGVNPHYAANLRLLADYRQYSSDEFHRLFEVQRQIMGDADKYRPDRRIGPEGTQPT